MCTDECTDERAIEAVLAGDTGAFATLVRRHQDRLFNTLAHLLCDPHEAEEVAQDAMLQAYSKLSSFRGGSSYYTWLYRIAFNLAMSRKRRRRPRVSLEEMQARAGLDPEGNVGTPDQGLLQDERSQKVHEALQRLDEDFRAVMILRELDGCDYATIAEMLDIPLGTVRSRLSRARDMMRDLLRESIGELDLS